MSAQVKDGGPAFPFDEKEGDGTHYHSHGGMTLRDYFAAKAMQSFMQGAVLPPGFDAAEQLAFTASRAYEVSDAMIAAREAKS